MAKIAGNVEGVCPGPGLCRASPVKTPRVSLLFFFLSALASSLAGAPALPMDAPWRVHQTTPARFPVRMLQDGVTAGEAHVRVSLSAEGELLDALVTSCSHRDFGEEAMRVVRQWRFIPARAEGRWVGVVGDLDFDFNTQGPIAIVKNPVVRADGQEERRGLLAYRAEGMSGLDKIPMPTHVVPPTFPRDWIALGVTGRATVEFFIDEEGRARVPVAVVADHPWLAGSAVAAVAQWRFAPPTRQGRPVLVRAEQVFTFDPDAPMRRP